MAALHAQQLLALQKELAAALAGAGEAQAPVQFAAAASAVRTAAVSAWRKAFNAELRLDGKGPGWDGRWALLSNKIAAAAGAVEHPLYLRPFLLNRLPAGGFHKAACWSGSVQGFRCRYP